MGHASSKEARHEPQNPRRLSKPPTSTPSFNASQSKIGKSSKGSTQSQSAPLDESMFWKSPWTGDLLPKVTTEAGLEESNRVRSFPSFSTLHPEPTLLTPGNKRWSSLDDFVLMKNDNSLSRSSSYITRRLSRKSSNTQRPGLQPQPGKMALGETRKEPIIHSGPSDMGNCGHRLSIENISPEGWSPVERSPVEDLCVPLSRRQSFRRPGIATRAPSWGLYRTPLSSIQQEDEKEQVCVLSSPLSSRGPLCEFEGQEEYMQVSSPVGRAASPVALDYSHLSGFKKGTLRIVNGSVSPASSDRIRLLAASSFVDELPQSVYSKEAFTSDEHYQNEAVDAPNNNLYYENHNASDIVQSAVTCDGLVSESISFTKMEKTPSTTNADSGYSSLGSVHSDNSSSQSSSPPSDSPISISPTQSEGGVPLEDYFYNQGHEKGNIKKTFMEPPLNNLGYDGYDEPQSILPPAGGKPRYYSQLSHLSTPSVPDQIAIDDRESDSENFYLDMTENGMIHEDQGPPTHSKQTLKDNTRGYLSTGRPHTARLSKSQPQLRHSSQASMTSPKAEKLPPVPPLPPQTSEILAYKEQTFDVTRGRARSRSIGQTRSKLVKTRKGKDCQR